MFWAQQGLLCSHEVTDITGALVRAVGLHKGVLLNADRPGASAALLSSHLGAC